MTVEHVIGMDSSLGGPPLVKDGATVTIQKMDAAGNRVRVRGKWYQDHILNYLSCEVHGLHWYPDGSVFIDI